MAVTKGIVLASFALSLGAFVQPARADGGQTGVASYYWQGKGTASGERFNANAMTAAHRSLPFDTKVKVTNLRNGRSVIVRINDRGPFIRGRIIDVSRAAAGELGFTRHGVTKVRVAVVDDEAETIALPIPKPPAKPAAIRVAAADAPAEPPAAQTPSDTPADATGGWTLVPPPSAAPAEPAEGTDAPAN
ncbi:rare lipoprotein A [Aquabacter spiritensis]|uniref:Endolytic peptidoglycan transglycosylase RlpA n=1 Tax=Aquabacter spiritensis TaxID=933073 RepID=A0A4R3LML7_9HYPH|nr:rare lipoprotein A [Aquabacter spiritensis]